jgi:hypothetical protein
LPSVAKLQPPIPCSLLLPLRRQTAPSGDVLGLALQGSQWRRGSSVGGEPTAVVRPPHLRPPALSCLATSSIHAREEGQLGFSGCAVNLGLCSECYESAFTLWCRDLYRTTLQQIFTVPTFTARCAIRQCRWFW